jgi:hypothetical protein
MIAAWFRAFLLTVAIETPLVILLTRDSRLPRAKRIALVVAAQLMTHPLVWYVFPTIPGMPRYSSFVLSEVWAWIAEAAFYALVEAAPSKLHAIGVSAIANGASLGLGFVVL